MKLNRHKVFLTGGDDLGWAVDEDLRMIRESIQPVADLCDLDEAQIVHSAWWEALMLVPQARLDGKRIICNMTGEPFRFITLPGHRDALPMVGRWVVRTRQAGLQMRAVGLDTAVIPYVVDVETFRPLHAQSPEMELLKERYRIPTGRYLIGSFQRDTEGSDLRSPKLVKGPDVLLEILTLLKARGIDIHLVLAGPRRHWLMARCSERGIPYTYAGTPVQGDDLEQNSLPRSTLNLLYNIIDLYVVASRSEGGPHAILEAAGTRCKVISTPVGMAPDVLEPSCIFSCPSDAVRLVEADIGTDHLRHATDLHFARVLERHTAEAAQPMFHDLYNNIETAPVFKATGATRKVPQANAMNNSNKRIVTLHHESQLSGITYGGERSQCIEQPGQARPLTVGLWHTFFKPPYGGGNQFMLALRKALLARNVNVRENELTPDIDAYVLNSIHFDVDRFLEFKARHRVNVVHRIDGPIHLIRGFDREKDELCYELNDRFASATILQSTWTYQKIVEMGYRPVKPVVIRNAVDSDIFHSRGRIPFDPDRKIRLISTSWSNNPRKGGPVYRWIEDNLDWDRFEYTFVGNASEQFSRVRHVPPVSSEELADLLRNHDIYITASRNDPCSNALIEALSCGLPALYMDDGGHPELVGMGGLPFKEESEILPQLDKLVETYDSFQKLIAVPTLQEVGDKYLAVVKEVVECADDDDCRKF